MGIRKEWNEALIERLFQEGRGKGHGPNYLPFLQISDISSSGLSRRTPCIKTGRVHHLLSNVEWEFFHMLQWSRDVVDIREQYPLPRDITREVALEVRIAHPYYPRTNVPTVMTVDFLVTRLRGGKEILEAYDIKRTEAAEDYRTIEKLELTRTTCELLEIPHYLIFHSELPQIKIRNLAWIAGAQSFDGEVELYPGFWDEHMHHILVAISNANQRIRLNAFCALFETKFGLLDGVGLRLARLQMQARKLSPCLNEPDLANAPLSTFVLIGPPTESCASGEQKC